MYEPIIKGKYKVTGYTRVIMISVEHKDDRIQWAGSASDSKEAGEPDTLKDKMTRLNGRLYKKLETSEIKNIL